MSHQKNGRSAINVIIMVKFGVADLRQYDICFVFIVLMNAIPSRFIHCVKSFNYSYSQNAKNLQSFCLRWFTTVLFFTNRRPKIITLDLTANILFFNHIVILY